MTKFVYYDTINNVIDFNLDFLQSGLYGGVSLMNDIIKALSERLELNGISCRIPEDREDAMWFAAKLPNHDFAPAFYVTYNPANRVGMILISRIAKIIKIGNSLASFMNSFNADPANLSYKAYVDRTGEFTFSSVSLFGSDAVNMLEYTVNTGIVCVDRCFGELSDILNSPEETEAEE